MKDNKENEYRRSNVSNQRFVSSIIEKKNLFIKRDSRLSFKS